MSTRIELCCWLRYWAYGLGEIVVNVSSVREALLTVAAWCPRMPPGFIDAEGTLNPRWMVYVDGEATNNPDAPLTKSCRVEILPKVLRA